MKTTISQGGNNWRKSTRLINAVVEGPSLSVSELIDRKDRQLAEW